MSETTAIDRVRRFAQAATDATKARDLQIREAHKQGHSLREIAQAAGVSHEQVRRILK